MPIIEHVLIHAIKLEHPSHLTSNLGWCWAKIVLNDAGKITALHLTIARSDRSNIPQNDEYEHTLLFNQNQLHHLDFILISYEDRTSAYMRIQQNRTMSRRTFSLDIDNYFMNIDLAEKAFVKQHNLCWSVSYYIVDRFEISTEEVQNSIPRASFQEHVGLPYEQHYEEFLQQQALATVLEARPTTQEERSTLPHGKILAAVRYGNNSIFNEGHASDDPVIAQPEVVERSSCCNIM